MSSVTRCEAGSSAWLEQHVVSPSDGRNTQQKASVLAHVYRADSDRDVHHKKKGTRGAALFAVLQPSSQADEAQQLADLRLVLEFSPWLHGVQGMHANFWRPGFFPRQWQEAAGVKKMRLRLDLLRLLRRKR
ncbi:hypothetical protein GUJ93_ZPchr0006g44207 [Zizania palustris]|uniref:Uncharacterized protein n=1 Tax=Zizania palustris TaxID=103762 RepID=A0A8J5SNL8_ZIZPA|nr:hypothetical protein GUJ93_ZPchr0006g44207 [Zizania palustris]